MTLESLVDCEKRLEEALEAVSDLFLLNCSSTDTLISELREKKSFGYKSGGRGGIQEGYSTHHPS
jgi:hypothetical protein